jgi:hypothetical protein
MAFMTPISRRMTAASALAACRRQYVSLSCMTGVRDIVSMHRLLAANQGRIVHASDTF